MFGRVTITLGIGPHSSTYGYTNIYQLISRQMITCLVDLLHLPGPGFNPDIVG